MVVILKPFGVIFPEDSWFLSALTSICHANLQVAMVSMKNIFMDPINMNDHEIPIYVWHFGEWKKIRMKPTLLTYKGRLCEMHASKQNIVWTSLLQKAYYQ